MQRVKAHNLRKFDDDKLVDELNKFRKELQDLRVSKVSSQPQVKLTKIRQVRKSIAKALTVLSEKRIDAAREENKKKRYTPKDLRLKKTRAWRRKLTKFEEKKLTLRAQKKA
jgi:large subunit ribosomal protein L35e